MKKHKIKKTIFLFAACLLTSAGLAAPTDGSYISPVSTLHQIPQKILVYKQLIGVSGNHQASNGGTGSVVTIPIQIHVMNPRCFNQTSAYSAYASIVSSGSVGQVQGSGECGIHNMTASAVVNQVIPQSDGTE